MQKGCGKIVMGDSSSPKSNVISKTKISTMVPGSPKGHMKRHNVLNFQQDNFDMEIKLASVDKCLVQVEIQEQGNDYVDGNDCTEPTVAAESPASKLREESKSRLRRLRKLYCSVESGGDAEMSSPIHHRSEEVASEAVVGNCSSQISHKGRSKLAALAHNINLWENESPLPLPMRTANTSLTTSTTKIKQQQGIISSRTPLASSATYQSLSSVVHKRNNKKSTLELNDSVVDALECQGYMREGADENKLLTYQFKRNKMIALNKGEQLSQQDNEGLDEKVCVASMSKHNRDVVPCKKFVPSIRMIEEEMRTPRGRPSIYSLPKDKDPSALSLHERKAIFERNADKKPLLPKTPIALSSSVSAALKKTSKPIEVSVADGRMENDLNWGRTVGLADGGGGSGGGGEKKLKDVGGKENVNGGGIVSHRLMTLRNNKENNLDDYNVTISQQQIENKIREERQRDMDVLMNRFHKPCSNSGNKNYAYLHGEEDKFEVETDVQIQAGTHKCRLSSPRKTKPHNNLLSASGCSGQVQSVLENAREIRVRRNSHGQRRLYPVLSDLETATETETEVAEELNDDYDNDDVTSEDDNASSLELSLSASSSSMDREDSENCGPTPPKCGKILFKSPVKSANYYQQQQQHQQPSDVQDTQAGIAVAGVSAARTTGQQVKAGGQFTPTHVVDGDKVIPLQHTVSFYRKQQQHYKVSQSVCIDLKQQGDALDSVQDEELAAVDSKKQLLLEKINSLHVEVQKQERTVAQSSQALTLCNARLEFNGSTEQVEAERLLLIAAHRRQAAMYEIGKLQVALMHDDTIDDVGQRHEHTTMSGDLVIGRLTLPLKREYVRALGAAGGNGHHVVCLIKCEDAKQQVLATKVVSTTANSEQTSVEGVVDINNSLELNSIKPQSTVTVEVYCLQAHDQHLPHHIKYHIKHAKHTTPRKLQLLMRTGKEDSDKMTRIPIESPGGPNTTRSSSFALMGYAIFAVRSLVDNTQNGRHPPFTLNQTPQMSPLEGSVQLSQILCKWTMPALERRGFLTMFEDVSGFGAWHRRWFRLDGNAARLQYWRYPDDELERDGKVIELNKCRGSVGLVPREVCARLHTILLLEGNVDSPTRRYLLSADTKEERVAWCHDINRVIGAMQHM